MSEDFSPAEQAYFSSKGADTSGLESESATETPQAPASNEGNGAQPASYTPTSGPPEGLDGVEDGEEVVIVGKDGKPRAQNGRFVPHQALHAERERRKATETELGTYREKMARADERLAVLNELMSKPEAPPSQGKVAEQTIDPEQDPIGALKQSYAKIAALEQKLTESTKTVEERESARAMVSAYQNDAARFVQEKPEFRDAYVHLMTGRHRELEAMGMTDADERNRFIANEERQLVASAFQSRRSPAQMLYSLAVARGFSYTPPAPAPAKPDHAAKIESIAKGQRQAGASLSAAGGSAGEGLTAAALADMTDEEFSALSAKLGKSKMRQLMGG
jgi:antitoxin (DNA-binding transcriptional repressor) of toxin-antitoxin stability system